MGIVNARLNQTMSMLAANPDFMANFGEGRGSTEQKIGMLRLREAFRGIEYKNMSYHDPIYSNLYVRADSIDDVNKNEKFIAETVRQRMADPAYRADADDGLIFARQLERIDPRRFMVKYRPRGMWRGILPQQNVERGLERVTYRIEDFRAQVKPITVGTQKDIPYVGVSTEEYTNYVIDKGLGYRYTVMELDRAAFAGVPLQNRYQQAVIWGYEESDDIIAFNGDTERSLEGVINHTGVSNVQAAAPATGTDRKWSGADKTEDEIIADIRGMVTKVAVDSKENYNAERTKFLLLLPRTPADALNKPRATFSDKTIAEFILSNSKYGIADIKVLPQLAGQGTGSTDLAILMPINDNEVIEFYTSDAILWEPAQFVGLDVRFPSRKRNGGVVIRYPFAMTQLYGI